MAKDLILFKNKEHKTRQQVSDFLRELAEKVSDGNVQLKQSQEYVSLQLPENIIMEVEVKDKDKARRGIQHQLEIEIKWYDNSDESGPTELG